MVKNRHKLQPKNNNKTPLSETMFYYKEIKLIEGL